LAGLLSYFAAKLPLSGRICDEAERLGGDEDTTHTMRAWILGAADL
jgi:hypothetical protein